MGEYNSSSGPVGCCGCAAASSGMAEAGPRGSLWCELGAVSLGAYAEAIAEEGGADEGTSAIGTDWLIRPLLVSTLHTSCIKIVEKCNPPHPRTLSWLRNSIHDISDCLNINEYLFILLFNN